MKKNEKRRNSCFALSPEQSRFAENRKTELGICRHETFLIQNFVSFIKMSKSSASPRHEPLTEKRGSITPNVRRNASEKEESTRFRVSQ